MSVAKILATGEVAAPLSLHIHVSEPHLSISHSFVTGRKQLLVSTQKRVGVQALPGTARTQGLHKTQNSMS